MVVSVQTRIEEMNYSHKNRYPELYFGNTYIYIYDMALFLS